MYPNASGPHAPRTSGPHQRPTHPVYAQPRVTGPHQASGPHRVTGPQQAVPTRGTGPHQAPPRRPAPPAKQAGPKLVAAAVALAVLGGVGGWLAYDAPAENQYQTVSYAGDNPFTSPVGADRPDVKPVAAGGARRADTPQMFSQDPAKPACDAESLTGQLQADPDKAAAWAKVQRIQPNQLRAFVGGLTPVVLRANTAVVDHGYVDGAFQATPAVLAPGTAVFINSFGQPTVKCFSGNPLTPGTSDDPAVATVTPTAAPITINVFNDVTTDTSISIPGKPDTTGTGPATGGDEGGGGGGGTVKPAPPVTGVWNGDGSITLSNGTIRTAAGAIITLPKPPEGSTPIDGGGFKDKDGKLFNGDGTERRDISLFGGVFKVNAQGQLLNKKGEVITTDKIKIFRNPNGSVTIVTKNADGTDHVLNADKDGKTTKGIDGTFDPKTGGVTDKDGKVFNSTGTPREKTKIEGGGTLDPDGKNTPPETKKGDNLVADNDAEKVVPNTLAGENAKVDPATGQPIDPATGQNVDPATGQPIDPATGQNVDPATGQPIDPATGQPIDPATGQNVEPATGQPVDQAPVDQAPVDQAPVDQAPVDQAPVDQAPVDQAPVDQAPVDQAPVDQAPVDQAPVDTGTTTRGQSTGGASTGSASTGATSGGATEEGSG